MSASKPTLIAIVGPTASGKTDLALKLARKFNGELVSADSRQVYKGLDIGTAKPTGGRWRKRYKESAYVIKGVPIFLMDVASPRQTYTVSDYQKDANRVIKKILEAGKLPILVGGTGLYIKSVLENLEIPSVRPDLKLRRRLQKELDAKGLEFLYKHLLKFDPAAKKFIDPKNPRRVMRALEVCIQTGRPFSELRTRGEDAYDALILAPDLSREELYERINKRVDQMASAGLPKEVKSLAEKYTWKAPALNALGYQQFKDYFAGTKTLEQTKDEIKKLTRHYAKRQMTWFRKQQPGIKRVSNIKEAERLSKQFLQK